MSEDGDYSKALQEHDEFGALLKREALKYVDQVLMPRERRDHPRSSETYFTRRRLQLLKNENEKVDAAVARRKEERLMVWRTQKALAASASERSKWDDL